MTNSTTIKLNGFAKVLVPLILGASAFYSGFRLVEYRLSHVENDVSDHEIVIKKVVTDIAVIKDIVEKL